MVARALVDQAADGRVHEVLDERPEAVAVERLRSRLPEEPAHDGHAVEQRRDRGEPVRVGALRLLDDVPRRFELARPAGLADHQDAGHYSSLNSRWRSCWSSRS